MATKREQIGEALWRLAARGGGYLAVSEPAPIVLDGNLVVESLSVSYPAVREVPEDGFDALDPRFLWTIYGPVPSSGCLH